MTTATQSDALAVPVVRPPAALLVGIMRLPEAAELVNKPKRWLREQVEARQAATRQVEPWHIPRPSRSLEWQRRDFYLWALAMGLLGPVPYLGGLRVIGYAGIAARKGVTVQAVRATPGRQRTRTGPPGWERRTPMPSPVAIVDGGRAKMPMFPLDDAGPLGPFGVETWLNETRKRP